MKLPSEAYSETCKGFKMPSQSCLLIPIQKAERALIERAEKAEANLSNYESMKMTNEAMSKKLLELEAQIPKWIPVCERLPDKEYELYLVRYSTSVGKETYVMVYSDEFHFHTINDFTGDPVSYKRSVTHWMPLPLPPTE